jgi:hypothetical protein
MIKEGLKVTIGCKAITLDQCRAIFNKIANAGG